MNCFNKKVAVMLSILVSAQTASSGTMGPAWEKKFNNVQLDIAVGPTWYNSSNGAIVVSPYETDADVVNSVSSTAGLRLGVGYHLWSDYFDNRQYLNDLLLELNWYYSSGSIKGTVWQSQEAIFDNYNFRAPFTSNRIMVDGKLGLLTYRQFTPYALGGIGAAWTNLAYHESIADPAAVSSNSFLNLKGSTNTKFAYDVGAGIQYAVNQHLGATIEYVYTYLYSISPSHTNAAPASQAVIETAPAFRLSNSNLLFGIYWRFC